MNEDLMQPHRTETISLIKRRRVKAVNALHTIFCIKVMSDCELTLQNLRIELKIVLTASFLI